MPLMGVLVGVVLTALVQSSTIVTGLCIVLVQQAILTAHAAIPIVAITVSTLSNPVTVGQFVLFNISITPAPQNATLSVMDGQTATTTLTPAIIPSRSFGPATRTPPDPPPC
jgi:hypothetical protein